MYTTNTLLRIGWYPYQSDPSSLIRCLYNEFGCMSSIMITIDDASIMIDSATDSSFSGRKYNKLVRCTLIILSLLLSKHIKRVTSHSINPISAYLSVKYFGGIVSHFEEVNVDFFWLFTTKGNTYGAPECVAASASDANQFQRPKTLFGPSLFGLSKSCDAFVIVRAECKTQKHAN